MREIEKRILQKVKKTNTCWYWTGSCNVKGYGQVKFFCKFIKTHRLFYEFYIGEIPKGYVIDHTCRVRNCVNPKHLEAVTNKENILRGFGSPAINARKTFCKNGHEFTEENIIRRKDSCNGHGRRCRQCTKSNAAKYRKNRRIKRSHVISTT